MILGEKISKTGKISYESIKNRAIQLKNHIDEFFIITNIASIRSDDIVDAFKKSVNKIDMICVDECHRLATKSAAQSTNLLKLDAEYKVGMSGSLVTNNPLSCYVPLY
jgi:superfamily II DNA or RNA helicase